jgi:hypothetical protein
MSFILHFKIAIIFYQLALTLINGILFFVVALIYSTAGFGGGSMYLAVLSQSGQDVSWIRFTGLSCNAAVTAQGTWRFTRQGWLALKPVLLLLLFSVPPCIASSFWKMSERGYFLVLAFCLLAAGLAMFFQPMVSSENKTPRNGIWLYPASALIGMISGLTGIGGGVYLSPLLHLTRWGSAKHIAAASSLFILVNSVAGLVVHCINRSAHFDFSNMTLIFCVLVGGLIGSHFGSSALRQKHVKNITAVIILFASLRILWKYL